MKKFVSVITVLIILLSTCCFTVFAEETESKMIIIEDSGYEFTIYEKIDEYDRVIRIFKNDRKQNTTNDDLKYDYIKVVLKALGMKERNIELLNEEALQAFAAGEEIILATSYSKTDIDNNTIYLPANEAIASAQALKKQQEILKTITPKSRALLSSNYSDYFQDSYMRVDYAVTHRGNGEYFYSVDSDWLTMPFYRNFDSLGACAQHGTVTPGTQYGYYWYDITYINGDNITYGSDFEYIGSDYGNAVNGNWYGSAGYFDLPNNIYNDYSSTIYDGFGAHFQYKGHVTTPSLETWFNTIGSYTHTKRTLSFSPSIAIRFPNSLSASVGISFNTGTDIRGVELEINYIP